MSFISGVSGNLNGRPKGRKARKKPVLRIFRVLVENSKDTIENDLKLMEPKDRVLTILKIAEFLNGTTEATKLI